MSDAALLSRRGRWQGVAVPSRRRRWCAVASGAAARRGVFQLRVPPVAPDESPRRPCIVSVRVSDFWHGLRGPTKMTCGFNGRLDGARSCSHIRAVTLPIYLAVHLAYGAFMAQVFLRRMRSEDDVVGLPLVATLAPHALTAPLGAVLLRYAGGWFLHGSLHGDGSIGYERFHLGIMILVGVLGGLCTVAGLFVGVAFLSRDRPREALAPVAIAALVCIIVVVLDGRGVFVVSGTQGRLLFFHPAGLISAAIPLVLVASWALARARLAEPTGPPGAPGSIAL